MRQVTEEYNEELVHRNTGFKPLELFRCGTTKKFKLAAANLLASFKEEDAKIAIGLVCLLTPGHYIAKNSDPPRKY